ncbi:AAA family ATPase [Streptomyces sp. NPDC019937]|uniref:ATP-binding protein n=1 Tax=Streptomyces sp. NPDC019937 TaxID=3154787 RepID=UPI0034005965
MTLIERAHQRALLQDLFSKALHRRGGTAVLHGPLGCGRTELLRAITEHAVETGALVLRADCIQAERHVPLGVLRQLFTASPGTPDVLRQAFFDLWNGAAPRSAPAALKSGHPPLPSWAAGELLSLVHATAAKTPLVIAVDDVQHADEPSIHFLSRLVQSIRTARVLVVLTECPALPAHAQSPASDALTSPYVRRIPVPALSPLGVHHLLSAHLTAREADCYAASCHRVSGGNPLVVQALLAEHLDHGTVRTGKEHAPFQASEATARTVLSMLRRGSPELLTVARALALLGEWGGASSISRVLELGKDRVTAALEALDEMGVTHEDGFRHALVATGLLEDPDFHEHKVLSLATARVLYECGVPDLTVARHLINAGDAEPWARAPLIQAAQEMLAAGTPGLAVSALELAVQVSESHRGKAEITAFLSHVASRDNPGQLLRFIDPLLGYVREGALTGRCALSLVRHLIRYGREGDALEVIRTAGSAAEHLDAETAAALDHTRCFLRVNHPSVTWPLPVHPHVVRHRPWTGAAAGAGTTNGTELLERVLTNGPQDDLTPQALQVLETTRADDASLESALAVLEALTYTEHYDLANEWGSRLHDVATTHRLSRWSALLTALRSEIALHQGAPVAAQELGEESLGSLAPSLWGMEVAMPLSGLVLAYTETGQHQSAQQLLDKPVPREVFKTRFGLLHRYARSRHLLATGRYHAALEELSACGAMAKAWKFDTPTFLPWRSDAAVALQKLGDEEEARRLVLAQLERPGGDSPTARGTALRVLAGISRPSERLTLLRESAMLLSGKGSRLELARTLVDLTHNYRNHGDHAKAEMVAQQARFWADACGATALVSTVRGHSAEPIGPCVLPDCPTTEAESRAVLSEAEQRVAELAALGSSNREIARKLHVTVSTVEQHLTRAYRKLQIKRRSELPSRLISTPVDGTTGSRPGSPMQTGRPM